MKLFSIDIFNHQFIKLNYFSAKSEYYQITQKNYYKIYIEIITPFQKEILLLMQILTSMLKGFITFNYNLFFK